MVRLWTKKNAPQVKQKEQLIKLLRSLGDPATFTFGDNTVWISRTFDIVFFARISGRNNYC